MKRKRDNFSKRIIDILAQRVGFLCSNPTCKVPTVGPNSEINRATKVGEAAHITAAAIDGPRYDATLTHEERQSISNAIWLCCKCATLIDKDINRYSVELLKSWKVNAENTADKNLGNSKPNNENATSVNEKNATNIRFESKIQNGKEIWHIKNKGTSLACNIVVAYIKKTTRENQLVLCYDLSSGEKRPLDWILVAQIIVAMYEDTNGKKFLSLVTQDTTHTIFLNVDSTIIGEPKIFNGITFDDDEIKRIKALGTVRLHSLS